MEVTRMKHFVVASLLAVAAGAVVQAQDDAIEKALLPAPANMQKDATVVKFKPDGTYDTLKKGTNQMVCYDKSFLPGQQPISSECTVLANLPRAAQNIKFEAIEDRKQRQAAIDAAEKDGSRVKPEFGSVWIHAMGPDKDHLRHHTTIAVPGATGQSLGLPENGQKGGAWVMNAGTSTAHIMTPGS
jgi:hypothetical protein